MIMNMDAFLKDRNKYIEVHKKKEIAEDKIYNIKQKTAQVVNGPKAIIWTGGECYTWLRSVEE